MLDFSLSSLPLGSLAESSRKKKARKVPIVQEFGGQTINVFFMKVPPNNTFHFL
jgi:hypothetical protein